MDSVGVGAINNTMSTDQELGSFRSFRLSTCCDVFTELDMRDEGVWNTP